MEFYRDTWAEINLDAIEWNIKQTMKHLPRAVDLFAVVKANAYGHGDIQVAKTALEAGAKGLAVAFLDEALKIRQAGIKAPLLVLGASRAEDAPVAAKHNISLTVYDVKWLKSVSPALKEPLYVHIKCDTGMGRLGIKTAAELKEMEQLIEQSPCMRLEGIFTHFATADETQTDYYQTQLRCFRQLLSALAKLPRYVHCANSASTLRFQGEGFNAVRFGISMYGLTPSEEITPELPFALKPAFSLYTKIVHVKQLEAGEKVSYGAEYEAKEKEWIGTLPVGYADGWIRKLSGQEVLINGQRVPIVGRVCMDQCMIKLPEAYPAGTLVTLIGTEKTETVTMEELARKIGTINYEIPCLITARVPRIYKKSGETVFISNSLL